MKPLLLAAALTAAAPAAAETLKTVPAALDPSKAYVLVEYRLAPNSLAGMPGSRKYYPLTEGLWLARYDPLLGDIRGLGTAAANPVPAKQQASEGFRNREVVKGDGARLMLLAVEPDTWVIQGWGRTSFSLGSKSFRLEAGTVTDLGVVTAAIDWPDGEAPPKLTAGGAMKLMIFPFGAATKVAPTRVTFRPRSAGDIPVPASLVAALRPVTFTGGARFGNYLGGLVNRIEGVNASARDKAPAVEAGSERVQPGQ